MAPIRVSVPHSLGKAEAQRRLKRGFESLPKSGMLMVQQQVWTGDDLQFQLSAMGHRVPGKLEVRDDAVQLELDLPGIVRNLWKPIQSVLLKRARLLLERP
jgi:hypothetical protein